MVGQNLNSHVDDANLRLTYSVKQYCCTEWSQSFNIFGPEGTIVDLIVSSIRNIIASEDIPLQRHQSNCGMFK